MRGEINPGSIKMLSERARSERKTLFLYDEKLKRFGARATKTGEVSYILEYALGGRGAPKRRVTIARHGPVTPKQARDIAEDQLREIRVGPDGLRPDLNQKKREAITRLEEEKRAATFEQAWARYIERQKRKGRRRWKETDRLVRVGFIPKHGSQRLKAINEENIAAVIAEVEEHSQSGARQLYAALSPFFSWASEAKVRLIANNPMEDIKRPEPVKPRDRYLREDEIRAFWRATARMDWPFCPFYRLLLLTGQRREEVAAMRWDEINLADRVWIIPGARSKNGNEHHVYLSDQALTILDGLPSKHGLAFTTTGTTPVSGFSRAKERLDRLMQSEFGKPLAPWRVHDLRRTISTLAAGKKLRISESVIDRQLNHARAGMKRTYQHQDYLEERETALIAWSAYVAQITGEENHSS
jgi:integrase